VADPLVIIGRLDEAGQRLNQAREPAEVRQRIVDLAADAFRMDIVGLYLSDPATPDTLRLAARFDYPVEEAREQATVGEGIIGWVAERLEPALVPDVRADPRYLRGIAGARSEMAVPLAIGEELLGVLDVQSRNLSAFAETDLTVLGVFAAHAACALRGADQLERAARRLATLDDRTRRLDLLNRGARTLTRRNEVDVLLQEILALCIEAFDLRHCAVLLIEGDDGDTLVLRASIGYEDNAPVRLAIGEGITGHVAETGVPAYVPDVTKDPRYVAGAIGGRAEMAAPLKVYDKVIGVLDAESAEVGGFDEEDLDLFTSFAAQAAVAIRSAELTTMMRPNQGG
jgi:putative methionine-R-sulfoxide reductase with GAF domain